jgi:hypothetical protein
MDKAIRKNGAGPHSWGRLDDEKEHEFGALDDEQLEFEEETASSSDATDLGMP